MIRQREKVKEQIGERFRQLRVALNRSKVEMAALMGVTRPTYSKYEKGTLFPGFQPLRALVNMSGVSIDWLVFGKGDMFPGSETDRETQSLETLPADMVELIKAMKKNPLLHHQMMIHFHEFKQDNTPKGE